MTVAMDCGYCPGACTRVPENSCSSSYTYSPLQFVSFAHSNHRRRSRGTGLSFGSRVSPMLRSGLSYMASWDSRFRFGDVDFLGTVAGRYYICRQRNAGRVQASLLGVGAPEALVIGIVALLVFGPKGLAEVARTLGQSLKAFQPTIQELQQVSRDFKSTLEQEIGLDELRNPNPPATPPTYQQRPQTEALPPTYQQRPQTGVQKEAGAWEGSPQVKILGEDETKAAAFEQKKVED